MEPVELMGVQGNRVRLKRKTLEEMLQQCHLALQQLASGCDHDEDNVDDELEAPGETSSSTSGTCDTDTSEFYGLLKSRVECADFLQKLENAQVYLPENITEESSSWEMVSEDDLWKGGDVDLDPEDYVLVGQEDIMDGIVSFMATYLLSLKQTKDLTPINFKPVALCKTFSVNKKKGKLRKAWDGSKVIYNVASWGATAIGLYQNPALFRVASTVFWSSCHVITKLL